MSGHIILISLGVPFDSIRTTKSSAHRDTRNYGKEDKG